MNRTIARLGSRRLTTLDRVSCAAATIVAIFGGFFGGFFGGVYYGGPWGIF